jgi:hypothetical protein
VTNALPQKTIVRTRPAYTRPCDRPGEPATYPHGTPSCRLSLRRPAGCIQGHWMCHALHGDHVDQVSGGEPLSAAPGRADRAVDPPREGVQDMRRMHVVVASLYCCCVVIMLPALWARHPVAPVAIVPVRQLGAAKRRPAVAATAVRVSAVAPTASCRTPSVHRSRTYGKPAMNLPDPRAARSGRPCVGAVVVLRSSPNRVVAVDINRPEENCPAQGGACAPRCSGTSSRVARWALGKKGGGGEPWQEEQFPKFEVAESGDAAVWHTRQAGASGTGEAPITAWQRPQPAVTSSNPDCVTPRWSGSRNRVA